MANVMKFLVLFSLFVLYDCHKFHYIVDYHFVQRDTMQAAIDGGEFIENAEYSGNMYGTR